MIKAIIIEDEIFSQELLVMKLTVLFPEISIRKAIDNIADAIQYLESEEVDIVFMDNQIKGGTANDILDHLPSGLHFNIIYTTAFAEYAIDALNRGASYYLLKPFSEEDLRSAVQKVLNSLYEKKNVIHISGSGVNQMISMTDLMFVESQGTYSVFHLSNGRSIMSSKNLGYFEQRLSSPRFFRIHHSCILNLEYIEAVVKGRNPKIILKPNGKELNISQRKAPAFFEVLKQFK